MLRIMDGVPARIKMDTEWILDSTFTLGQLTPLEYKTCRLHRGAYRLVRDMVDSDRVASDDFMVNVAAQTLQSASDEARFYLALHSLEALPFGLKGVRERAEGLLQDKVLGDLSPDDPLLPRPLERFRVRGERLFANAEAVNRDNAARFLSISLGPMLARLESDLGLLHEAAAWYRADDGARFWGIYSESDGLFFQPRMCGCDHREETDAVLRHLEEKEARASRRRARELKRQAAGPIRRCVRLFERLGRRDDLAVFINGGSIEIKHPSSHFKFVVTPSRRRGWLIDYTVHPVGHTPFELSLYTADDLFLTRLCVLPTDTPVLDQVLALMMFVESGHELELLEKANWLAAAPDDVLAQAVLPVYPQLREKLPGERARRAREMLPKIALPKEFVEAQRRWQPYAEQARGWIDEVLAPYHRLSQQAARLAPPALREAMGG